MLIASINERHEQLQDIVILLLWENPSGACVGPGHGDSKWGTSYLVKDLSRPSNQQTQLVDVISKHNYVLYFAQKTFISKPDQDRNVTP
jgi:hypothetical protein